MYIIENITFVIKIKLRFPIKKQSCIHEYNIQKNLLD